MWSHLILLVKQIQLFDQQKAAWFKSDFVSCASYIVLLLAIFFAYDIMWLQVKLQYI